MAGLGSVDTHNLQLCFGPLKSPRTCGSDIMTDTQQPVLGIDLGATTW